MKPDLLSRIYRALLYLFPSHFHAEFAREMQSVFAERLEDAAGGGASRLLETVCMEYSGLLREALSQQIRSQGRVDPAPPSRTKPASRREMLVSLAVFAVPAALILAESGPLYSFQILLPVAVVLILAAFLIGMLRGFPYWSLSYFGLTLSMVSFLVVFQWAADMIFPAVIARLGPGPWDESTRLVLQAFWAGLMWLSLFVLTFLVLKILALLRRFQGFIQLIRQDWTQFSYILYSGAVLALFLAFEEYRHERPFIIGALLCLATGAWLYLRSERQWQRGLSLLLGLTLAMWMTAFERLPVISLQGWAVLLSWQPIPSERWFEAQRILLDWGWMMLFLLAPALLRLTLGQDRSQPPPELRT